MTTATAENEWLAWRKQGLGASDIPALLGLSTFQSPWSLWAGKVGLLPDTEATERQQLGHDLEPVIAGRFQRATGLEVAGEQAWCAHAKNEWARATVDGFVVEPAPGVSIDDAIGVAEWKSDGGMGTWRKDGIPARVQAQVQWQMYVTGLQQAWVGVFHSGFRFEVYELHRDHRDIEFMVARAEAFWRDHVMTQEPPPVDGSDATAAAIGQVWPLHEPGKAVDLSDLADIIAHRDEMKAAAKVAKDSLAAAENLIKERMGDAEVATVHGLPALTYRSQERRDVDRERLQRDHPGLAAEYEKVKLFRVLRAAPKGKKARAA